MDNRDQKVMLLLEMYEEHSLKALSGMMDSMGEGDRQEFYTLITAVNTIDWKADLLPVLRRYMTEELCDMLINMMGSESYTQFISNLVPLFTDLEPVLFNMANKFKVALQQKKAA